MFAVMRGLEKVAQAIATHQQAECSRIWLNSSVRSVVHDACNQMEDRFSDVLVRPDVVKVIKLSKFSDVLVWPDVVKVVITSSVTSLSGRT